MPKVYPVLSPVRHNGTLYSPVGDAKGVIAAEDITAAEAKALQSAKAIGPAIELDARPTQQDSNTEKPQNEELTGAGSEGTDTPPEETSTTETQATDDASKSTKAAKAAKAEQ